MIERVSGQEDPSSQNQLIQLTHQLQKTYNKQGLQTLCLRLGIDHENLPSITKNGLARELVMHCDRYGLIPDLETAIEKTKTGRRDKLTEYRDRVLLDTHFLELKGIPLPLGRDGLPRVPQIPLDEIYIRLQAITREKKDSLEKEEEKQIRGEISDTLGEFISPMRQLAEYYYQRGKVYESAKRPKPVDPQQALAKNKRLVVLGAPGSGKSTMLRYLARRAVEDDYNLLPILVPLGAYAIAYASDPKLSLRQFALTYVASGDDLLHEALANAIENDQVFWLLDGLDEARNWAEMVAQQASQLPGSLLLTSRPLGYSGSGLNTLPHFEILPIAPEDVDTFLQDWFRILADDNRDSKEDITSRLRYLQMQLADRPQLQTLTHNPLLLTFLVTLTSREDQTELPIQRAQLYARYVDELLTWEFRRQTQVLDVEDWHLGMLQGKNALDAARIGFHYLGWTLHLNYYGGHGHRPPDKTLLVEILANYFERDGYAEVANLAEVVFAFWQKAGMLDTWELGKHTYVTFRHLTFQEYAAAWGLKCAWDKDARNTWRFILPRLHYYAWREPILLLMGLMTEDNRNQFVRNLLRGESHNERSLHRDLRLAGTLIAEGVLIDSKLRHYVTQRLGELLTRVYKINFFQRLALRLGYATLGRKHLIVILENIGDEVAVSYLITALKDKDWWHIGLHAIVALGNIGNAIAIPPLLELLTDTNFWIRVQVIGALGQIGKAIDRFDMIKGALYVALEDESVEVRLVAAEIIGPFTEIAARDQTCLSSLISALSDSNKKMRRQAGHILGQMGNLALPHLISASHNENPEVRAASALALGEIKDKKAVDALISILEDNNSDVKIAATYALGQIGDIAISKLICVLRESHDTYLYAVSALRIIGEGVIPNLLSMLKDTEEKARVSAALALGLIGSIQAITPLINALNDEANDVRIRAAYALGQIGNRATPDLIRFLGESGPIARLPAASALSQIGEDAVPHLIEALVSENENIRSSSALALGLMKATDAVPALIQALSDEKRDVQVAVSFALGEVGETAIPELISALDDENLFEFSVVALKQIGEVQDASDDRGDQLPINNIKDARILAAIIDMLMANEEFELASKIEVEEKLGNEEIIHLFRFLESDDMEIRHLIVKALNAIEVPARILETVVYALIKALDDSDNSVCFDIASLFGKIGEKALPSLIEALGDENINRRKFVAQALGRIESPNATPFLITALGDEHIEVFQNAIFALKQIKDERAIPHLIRILKDEVEQKRKLVIDALGVFRDNKLNLYFIQALEDKSKHVRRAAIWSLSPGENSSTLTPYLIRSLDDPEENVRDAAISALQGKIRRENDKAQLQHIKRVLWRHLTNTDDIAKKTFDAFEEVVLRLTMLNVERLPLVDPLNPSP